MIRTGTNQSSGIYYSLPLLQSMGVYNFGILRDNTLVQTKLLASELRLSKLESKEVNSVEIQKF